MVLTLTSSSSSVSPSVVYNSVTPWTIHGVLQARTLEWVAISFSRGIFLTQGSNPGLLHCRQNPYNLSYREVLVLTLRSS